MGAFRRNAGATLSARPLFFYIIYAGKAAVKCVKAKMFKIDGRME
jgi:hypothetical protein